MLALTFLRWLLGTSVGSPTSWLVLVLVGVSWPLLRTLMALGITTSSAPPQTALWQLGFLAILFGTSLGMYRLGKYSWWLRRTSPVKTALVEVLLLTCMGMIYGLAAYALAVPTLNRGELWDGLGRSGLACLHAALLGSLLLAALPEQPPTWSCAGLPVLGWLLPGICQGDSLVAQGLRQTCEIAQYFEFPSTQESAGPLWPWGFLTMLGLASLRLAVALNRYPTPCATPSSETSTPT